MSHEVTIELGNDKLILKISFGCVYARTELKASNMPSMTSTSELNPQSSNILKEAYLNYVLLWKQQ